ncbi:sag-related sequence srs53a [Cystoisospora suis]|uniref:Sag-related sequence srs53a n=1 Tax=Cystoisospora suis TaxID=483139 RepID=A0A2C6KLU0_9APIC|nr:sag-related sequence srs53a [Cystoisospora suis]
MTRAAACSVDSRPISQGMPPCYRCSIHRQQLGTYFVVLLFTPRSLSLQAGISCLGKELRSSGTASLAMGPFSLIPYGIAALALPALRVIAGDSEQLATLADVEATPVVRGVAGPGFFENDEKEASAGAEDSAGLVEAQPRRLSEPQVEQCSFTGGKTLTVAVSPYTLEAKFSCGDKADETIAVEPDCTSVKDKCCDSAGNTCQQQPIAEVAGVNGSATMDDASKVITVKLDGTPKNTDAKLYFKCKKSAENCMVTVDMPKPLTESQCNFNKNVEVPAISEPNKEVTFECGGSVASKPGTVDTEVFKGPDCTGTASKLSDLVPGAQLKETKDGCFTLSVSALPTEAQNLCFKCVYPDPTKTKTQQTCKVTVAVSGTSKTTTASTTTSAAEGTAVMSFAVVGLAFFSFAGSAYY